MRNRIFHAADIRLRNPIALSGQEVRKLLLGDFAFKLLFINGARFSNAQRLFDKREIAAHLVFRQMADNAFQTSRPWLEYALNAAKTFVTGFLIQLGQNSVAGIPAIAEYINVFGAVRIFGHLRN